MQAPHSMADTSAICLLTLDAGWTHSGELCINALLLTLTPGIWLDTVGN